MYDCPRKGLRRIRLDLARVQDGEPRKNLVRNQTPHCRFDAGAKAFRLKGRNRFKTGRKRQKPGKKQR